MNPHRSVEMSFPITSSNRHIDIYYILTLSENRSKTVMVIQLLLLLLPPLSEPRPLLLHLLLFLWSQNYTKTRDIIADQKIKRPTFYRRCRCGAVDTDSTFSMVTSDRFQVRVKNHLLILVKRMPDVSELWIHSRLWPTNIHSVPFKLRQPWRIWTHGAWVEYNFGNNVNMSCGQSLWA